MALDDDVRILSGVSLFEGFTQEQLRLLAFGAENLRVAAGRDIYREGHPADSAFVVVAGRITLFREDENDRIPLGEVGPGAMLGEFALIAEANRLTGASAATDTELIRLNRKLFRRILEEYPDIAVALHQRIVRDLQALVSSIEAVAPRFS